MNSRDYFSRKRTSSKKTDSHRYQAASGDAQSLTLTTVDDEEHQQPQKKKQHLTPCEKKSIYKAKLSYKQEWEKKYMVMPGSLVRI